jgi:raffinose/stachyose/melibiose transport system permease protein
MILDQVKLIAVLTVIHAIQSFESIFVLTKGMPGFTSMVPGLWMYLNAFSYQRIGYACAIGVILFLMVILATLLKSKLIRDKEVG